jgi:hypothetical protein
VLPTRGPGTYATVVELEDVAEVWVTLVTLPKMVVVLAVLVAETVVPVNTTKVHAPLVASAASKSSMGTLQ